MRIDVRDGSVADIAAALPNVRFTTESGRFDVHPHRKQDNSIGKTGQQSPQIEAIRGKPRIAIFLLITNSEASGTQKRKDGVMRSKHFLLLVVLFIAGTTNAAFAQHARMGGFAHLRSLGGGLTGPATTSGFHPNIGFGSSSAGGSGGTPTGPTIPGSSGAVSGMNLSGIGIGAR